MAFASTGKSPQSLILCDPHSLSPGKTRFGDGLETWLNKVDSQVYCEEGLLSAA